MTRREHIQICLDKVFAWDRDDILVLADLLYDLNFCITHVWDASMDRWDLTYEHLRDYLDLSMIPTCPVPGNIQTIEHIWSMDNRNNCLISLDFESTNYGHNFMNLIRPLDQLQVNGS